MNKLKYWINADDISESGRDDAERVSFIRVMCIVAGLTVGVSLIVYVAEAVF